MSKSKKPAPRPPLFHACYATVNVYTGLTEGGFCVQGRCNSADLFVTRIQKLKRPKNESDLRLKLLRVVNIDAQEPEHRKRNRKDG
jgi:hypothetical protein